MLTAHSLFFRLFWVTCCIFLPIGGFSQYHFDEYGTRANIGVNLPVGNSFILTGWGMGANVFYTHYRCGKRDGYHFEAGLRYFRNGEQADYAPSFFSEDKAGRFSYNFFNLDFSALYKFRLQNFHTVRETCFMAGLKLNVPIIATAAPVGQTSEALRNNYRKLLPVSPGFHISIWFRRPIDRDFSWFLIPGAEWYVLPTIQAKSDETNLTFNSFYIFFGGGFTFWNNR